MKTKEYKPSLASKKECTGCMACADACRHEALTMRRHDDGNWYPSVDSLSCVGCGACEKACPVINHLCYGKAEGKSTPFAAWTTDKELIAKSASGGIFAAMASYVLSIGGYVAGAVSVGQEVRHIVTNKAEDLPLLQGTKYLQSNVAGVYRRVKQLLTDGETVLFSGTGCQVGGLLQFLGGREYDNLYTIDLVCAGVPSSLIMTRYTEEELSTPPLCVQWRDKEHGWQHGLQLTITTEKEQIKPKTENCFLGGDFMGGMTSRWSCCDCRFTGADRLSDFTVGDFWGAPKRLQEQFFDGISVLIVHSEKGKELIKQCQIETRPTTWKECTANNPRILLGKRPLRWASFERMLVSWNFRHLCYGSLKKIYAGNIRKSDLLWLPYKVFKYLRWRLSERIIKSRVNGILKNL